MPVATRYMLKNRIEQKGEMEDIVTAVQVHEESNNVQNSATGVVSNKEVENVSIEDLKRQLVTLTNQLNKIEKNQYVPSCSSYTNVAENLRSSENRTFQYSQKFVLQFSGEGNDLTQPLHYFKKLERYIEVNNLYDQYRYIVEDSFVGSAIYWLDTLHESISWEEFKIKFHNRYWNDNVKNSIREKFINSKYDGKIDPVTYLHKTYVEAKQVFVGVYKITETELLRQIARQYGSLFFNTYRCARVDSIEEFENLVLEFTAQELMGNSSNKMYQQRPEQKNYSNYGERSMAPHRYKDNKFQSRTYPKRYENSGQYRPGNNNNYDYSSQSHSNQISENECTKPQERETERNFNVGNINVNLEKDVEIAGVSSQNVNASNLKLISDNSTNIVVQGNECTNSNEIILKINDVIDETTNKVYEIDSQVKICNDDIIEDEYSLNAPFNMGDNDNFIKNNIVENCDEIDLEPVMEPTINRRIPTVDGIVEGKNINILLDSGAEVSCINQDLYRSLIAKNKNICHLPVKGIKITGASEKKICNVQFQVFIEVRLGNVKLTVNCLVVPRLSYPIIFGSDLLNAIKGIINFKENILEFTINGKKENINFKEINMGREITVYGIKYHVLNYQPVMSKEGQLKDEINDDVNRATNFREEGKNIFFKLLNEFRDIFEDRIGNKFIKNDPDKLKAIKEYAVTKNCSELKGFLGIVNFYRRFSKRISQNLGPLSELLKKKVKWKWTKEI